jgi:glucan phosphorylase
MALELARDDKGQPIEITLQLPSTPLYLRAWRAQIGRVDLYLLDANVDKNRPEDRPSRTSSTAAIRSCACARRSCSAAAACACSRARTAAVGVPHQRGPRGASWRSARRAALIREPGLTFDEARELVRATTVFTTHTPVPAGHDRFGEDLMRRYFSDVENWLGVKWERFMSLARPRRTRAPST